MFILDSRILCKYERKPNSVTNAINKWPIRIVIKDTDKSKGNLQFGTEVITSEDGTLAALLGASPGASTAVDILFDVLQRCYQSEFSDWESKIKEMVPSFGLKLSEHEDVYHAVNKEITKYLNVK